jgi:hypothetical protein
VAGRFRRHFSCTFVYMINTYSLKHILILLCFSAKWPENWTNFLGTWPHIEPRERERDRDGGDEARWRTLSPLQLHSIFIYIFNIYRIFLTQLIISLHRIKGFCHKNIFFICCFAVYISLF